MYSNFGTYFFFFCSLLFFLNTKNLPQVGHDNWVRGVQFHPSGKYLLSVSDDKSIRVWDLQQGRTVKQIQDAHEHFISCLDYNTNNPSLVTGGVDNVLKIWNCR